VSSRALRVALGGALLALAGLFAAWFLGRGHLATALVVFIAPPLLLAAGVVAGRRTAAFWSGVFGLMWFSHGVMVAWAEPAERLYASVEVLLALAIIALASWPGLAARFGAGARPREHADG